jgi:hypothetical protein
MLLQEPRRNAAEAPAYAQEAEIRTGITDGMSDVRRIHDCAVTRADEQ